MRSILEQMLGTVRAHRSFIDAFAGFLVLREARVLDLAVRQRPGAAQGDCADAALARLAAGRAVGELGVGETLHHLEQAIAFFAVARGGGVFVDRHQRILPWMGRTVCDSRPAAPAANWLESQCPCGSPAVSPMRLRLSLIHISEPTRLGMISYA